MPAVDYNRSGVALIEIVGDPDLRSSEEAEIYLKRLREVLMFIGVNDGNLEEGSFRCDANVSLRPVGQREFGTRVELKNINSFRFVRKALDYEIARQEAVLSSGGKIVQETRTWSEGQGKTLPMRGKEQAHDYRYFPDPDLPPLKLEEGLIARVAERMPELPEAKRARWCKDAGLSEYDAQVLTGHPRVAAFFEGCVEALSKALGSERRAELGKKAANFIQAELLRYVRSDGLQATFPVTESQLVELLLLVEDGTLSGKLAKTVFVEMVERGQSAKRVVERQGLVQVTDAASIEAEIRKVFEAHPDKVSKYREGKTNLMGFFVGQVMQATRGKANPKVVNDSLKKMLEASE